MPCELRNEKTGVKRDSSQTYYHAGIQAVGIQGVGGAHESLHLRVETTFNNLSLKISGLL